MCVEPVVAGRQSCQNHLAGPVKKVVCILVLFGFQRCFDDGGLFVVMDAGGWLLIDNNNINIYNYYNNYNNSISNSNINNNFSSNINTENYSYNYNSSIKNIINIFVNNIIITPITLLTSTQKLLSLWRESIARVKVVYSLSPNVPLLGSMNTKQGALKYM